MNVRNAVTYLLNPRSRYEKMASLTTDEDADWSRPQLLSTGAFVLNFPLVLGLIVVTGLILIILFGPLWATHDPHITTQAFIPYYDADLRELVKPPFAPSRQHPLGTDTWGNDLLSLILHGARVTVIAGAYITAIRVILGAAVGSLAGWFANSWFDRLVMSLISAVVAIPTLLGAMILILALNIQNGLWVFIVALAVLGWTEAAQYIRGEMLVIRKMPYIEGAHAVGLNHMQIIVRHALPNILSQVLLMTFLEMGAVLILLAELGFLGIYIGGGTFYTVDIFDSGGPQLLNEVPEWGTLVSIGAPYLRSYPYMVLAPASAFFITVVGLNALGEGLRQAMERSAVSTNFLLQKRMLLVVAAFIVGTALVLKYTGPSLSFSQVAAAFDGEASYEHVAALSQMDGRGAGQEGGSQAATYIEEQFKKIGLQPGWKVGINSRYDYRTTTMVARPSTQPQLTLLNDDDTVRESFQHQIDFGYVIDGHGGSGKVAAPLTFIGFQPGEIGLKSSDYDPAVFTGLNVRGRIIMMMTGNAPEYMATELLRRGALGVLWVTAVADPIHSQIQFADLGKPHLRNPAIPIFRLSETVADVLLEPNGVTLRQILMDAHGAAQSGSGWFTHEFHTRVNMSLRLEASREIEIQHVLGFFPGYDDNLADQLVVIFASYDGLGMESNGSSFPTANQSASGVAVLLEMARLWEQNNLDPRRSVLFVAWGDSQLDRSEAAAFLENEDNFRKLAARVNTPSLKPALVFQLGAVGTGGEDMWISPASDADLMALWTETAASTNLSITTDEAGSPLITQKIPTLSLRWANTAVPLGQDTLEQIKPDKLQQVGETLTLALIKILRQVNY